ncbi:hypothetical protein DKAM_0555 [Desulfurococcus amylolyticus 1221n]|uniref:Uncharacterized protein n=2 Tax=Desulfurococcus amylolyticus TaxID=94694 RepID=B8D450_DESA1|nr:hypothetical protein DKAM_0555 [Desulfurococcus amylolyticus 1221n]
MLESCRFKIAQALSEGKPIKLVPGSLRRERKVYNELKYISYG